MPRRTPLIQEDSMDRNDDIYNYVLAITSISENNARRKARRYLSVKWGPVQNDIRIIGSERTNREPSFNAKRLDRILIGPLSVYEVEAVVVT